MNNIKNNNYLLPIIVLNLIPLYGVYAWNWLFFDIIFLYWVENIIVGVIHFFKLALSGIRNVLAGIFFIIHYGMFTAGHGVFVIAVFGQDTVKASDSNGFFEFFNYLATQNHIDYAIYSLAILHIYHWLTYVLHSGLKVNKISRQFFAPYKRIIVLHITIIFGGFIMIALNMPSGGFAILILLKIYFDVNESKKQQLPIADKSTFKTV